MRTSSLLLVATTVPAASRAATQFPLLAADPLPFADVKLTGEWAENQARNQEVLLSLNQSRFLCHFTTTANMTSCRPASDPWHTYVKETIAGENFTYIMHNFKYNYVGTKYTLKKIVTCLHDMTT